VRPEVAQEAREACATLRLIGKARKRVRRPTPQELARLRDYFAARDRSRRPRNSFRHCCARDCGRRSLYKRRFKSEPLWRPGRRKPVLSQTHRSIELSQVPVESTERQVSGLARDLENEAVGEPEYGTLPEVLQGTDNHVRILQS
jgi:hypothetical protein